MLFTAIISNFLLVIHTISNSKAQNAVHFDEESLIKLRLTQDATSNVLSYLELEILNEYQCAIECIKDRTACVGFSYDGSTKKCSLYDDTTGIVNQDIEKLRAHIKPNVCDNINCKVGAICVSYNKNGKETPNCICINGQSTADDCDAIEIGTWSRYSQWSDCSVTCGEGYRHRKRQCSSYNDNTRLIPNERCSGKDIEIQPCDIKSCPIYDNWSAWSPCSTFCGIGVKVRNRSCIPPGSNCGNHTQEQRACGTANCQRVAGIKETEPEKYPLKGYLSIREGDILCIPKNGSTTAKHMADLVCKSIGLRRGAQYAVISPIFKNSTCYRGILCDGTEKNFLDCKYDPTLRSLQKSDLYAILTRCIIDGGFSAWSEWSPCTKSCGAGESRRFRSCTDPPPSTIEPQMMHIDQSFAGNNCTGEYKQAKSCNTQSC